MQVNIIFSYKAIIKGTALAQFCREVYFIKAGVGWCQRETKAKSNGITVNAGIGIVGSIVYVNIALIVYKP